VLRAASPEVAAYVYSLEARLVHAHTRLALQRQVNDSRPATHRHGSDAGTDDNALLQFLKLMDSRQVEAMSRGTPAARRAVRALVDRIVGVMPPRANRPAGEVHALGGEDDDALHVEVRASRDYVHQLLTWTMHAGYHLRCCEERATLDASLDIIAADDQGGSTPLFGREWRPFLRDV
jgi:hypothetical protein